MVRFNLIKFKDPRESKSKNVSVPTSGSYTYNRVDNTIMQGNLQVSPYAGDANTPASNDPLVVIDGSLNVTGNTHSSAYRFHVQDTCFNLAVGNDVLRNVKQSTDNLNFGTYNEGFGTNALENLEFGYKNTAIGTDSLRSGKNMSQNVVIGHSAMNNCGSDGSEVTFNTIVGYEAVKEGGENNVGNTAIGTFSQFHLNNAEFNTSIGYNSLNLNHGGNENTAIGAEALGDLSGGVRNIGLGVRSGLLLQNGCENNIFIGNSSTNNGGININSSIVLGNNSTNNGNNAMVIGNDVSGHGSNVIVLGNKSQTLMEPDSTKVMDIGSVQHNYKNYYGEIVNSNIDTAYVSSIKPDLFENIIGKTNIYRLGGEVITTINMDLNGLTCSTNSDKDNESNNFIKIVGGGVSSKSPFLFFNNCKNSQGSEESLNVYQIKLIYNNIPLSNDVSAETSINFVIMPAVFINGTDELDHSRLPKTGDLIADYDTIQSLDDLQIGINHLSMVNKVQIQNRDYPMTISIPANYLVYMVCRQLNGNFITNNVSTKLTFTSESLHINDYTSSQPAAFFQ